MPSHLGRRANGATMSHGVADPYECRCVVGVANGALNLSYRSPYHAGYWRARREGLPKCKAKFAEAPRVAQGADSRSNLHPVLRASQKTRIFTHFADICEICSADAIVGRI